MILDGKLVAADIKAKVKAEVDSILAEGKPQPGLAVIIIGDNPASHVYVKNKQKACEEVGLVSQTYKLNEKISEEDLLILIDQLNKDKDTHGILVQMPLPKHIDANKVIDAIDPKKDVDGFHPINVGNMMIGKDALIPCTPHGIIKMLEYYKIKYEGVKAVVIGRSNIVGKPMAALLQKANMTVTVCHTKTPKSDIKRFCREAQLIVVATGVPNTLTADMLSKPKCQIIIDVGINRVDGKLCGDVDFENVKEVAGYITPVPGGVGPLTIAMLMSNTLQAYKNQQ